MKSIKHAATIAKHPQSVLGFFTTFFEERARSAENPNGFANGITEMDYDQFMSEIQPYHIFGVRGFLENFAQVRHPAHYIDVQTLGDNGELMHHPYRRLQGGGEARIAGNVAAGYGGHTDWEDAVVSEKGVVSVIQTMATALAREAHEEFAIKDLQGDVITMNELYVRTGTWIEPTNLFIVDSTNDVNTHHVAVIYKLVLPKGYTLHVMEEELSYMPPMTAQDILDSGFPLESWADIYYRHVVATALLDSGATISIDPESIVDIPPVWNGTVDADTPELRALAAEFVVDAYMPVLVDDAALAVANKIAKLFTAVELKELYQNQLLKPVALRDLFPNKAFVLPTLFDVRDEGNWTIVNLLAHLATMSDSAFDETVNLAVNGYWDKPMIDPQTNKPYPNVYPEPSEELKTTLVAARSVVQSYLPGISDANKDKVAERLTHLFGLQDLKDLVLKNPTKVALKNLFPAHADLFPDLFDVQSQVEGPWTIVNLMYYLVNFPEQEFKEMVTVSQVTDQDTGEAKGPKYITRKGIKIVIGDAHLATEEILKAMAPVVMLDTEKLVAHGENYDVKVSGLQHYPVRPEDSNKAISLDMSAGGPPFGHEYFNEAGGLRSERDDQGPWNPDGSLIAAGDRVFVLGVDTGDGPDMTGTVEAFNRNPNIQNVEMVNCRVVNTYDESNNTIDMPTDLVQQIETARAAAPPDADTKILDTLTTLVRFAVESGELRKTVTGIDDIETNAVLAEGIKAGYENDMANVKAIAAAVPAVELDVTLPPNLVYRAGRMYPVWRPESAPCFVDRGLGLMHTIKVSDDESIVTAPLAMGVAFNLISISQQENTDPTDSITDKGELESIYLKLVLPNVDGVATDVSEVFKFVVDEKSAKMNNSGNLMFDLFVGIELTRNTPTVEGRRSTIINTLLGGHGDKIVLSVEMHGVVNQQTGTAKVVSAPVLLDRVEWVGHKTSEDAPAVMAMVKQALFVSDWIGYDLDINRVNLNRRYTH